jgi:uncharacterized protein YceK
MKNMITLFLLVVLLASCARSVSIHQAAGGGYKSVRNVR